MAKKKQPTKTADEVILHVLLYEFGFDVPVEIERKIKRRLRYYRLGPYQQTRIDLLRRFKDEVQDEIGLFDRSRYHLGNHTGYAAMEDFDFERLTQDLSAAYPEIPLAEIAAFLPGAIYLYYMR